MNILFVCNEYPPVKYGGIGIFVQTLAHRLVGLGCNVIVVGYGDNNHNGWQEDGPVKVLYLRRPTWAQATLNIGHYNLTPSFWIDRYFLAYQISRVSKKYNIDLVESYDWSGPLGYKPVEPLIVRLHGANTAHAFFENKRPSWLLKRVERRNVAQADALAAVSKHIGSVTLKALGLEGRDFTVLYNGVDTQQFRPLDVEPDDTEVLYVGSIRPRKGLYELFEAIPYIFEVFPKAHFTFVGRAAAGEKGEQFKQQLMSKVPVGKWDAIDFKGYVPHAQLPHLYNLAAVSVFPSRAEAFGLTCAEAMACGAAVAMTSKASGPELVEDGNSGLLADPSNPQIFAEAVCKLLKDRELREKIGEQARLRAEMKFSIDHLALQNLVFYQEVLEVSR